jgi:hypothetical protein
MAGALATAQRGTMFSLGADPLPLGARGFAARNGAAKRFALLGF